MGFEPKFAKRNQVPNIPEEKSQRLLQDRSKDDKVAKKNSSSEQD